MDLTNKEWEHLLKRLKEGPTEEQKQIFKKSLEIYKQIKEKV